MNLIRLMLLRSLAKKDAQQLAVIALSFVTWTMPVHSGRLRLFAIAMALRCHRYVISTSARKSAMCARSLSHAIDGARAAARHRSSLDEVLRTASSVLEAEEGVVPDHVASWMMTISPCLRERKRRRAGGQR